MAAKIRKNTLEIEYSYDFELLGIRTSLKGYKLAWELNNALQVHLVKQADLVLHFKKGATSSHDHYSYQTPLNNLHLFRNRAADSENNAPDLVPEFPHFDFILMTQSEENLSGNRLQEYLRAISSIELATLIPLATLKSKENFIF
ncbi:MAG TPA: IPExxxVDY family protein [Cyclobacteriaceae bacterium]|nr:IPExxxVDY family protein [Cyclobacteriaceae bacterium]